METILITGASRGIGLELCRQFLQRGCRVIATYRGEPSAELSALGSSSISLHRLEVTQQASIDTFVSALKGQSIDVLINNAGVLGPNQQGLSDIDIEGWLHTFAVNSISPLAVSQSLLENLKQSANARIVTITSQMGSFNHQASDMYAYQSSKAAANKVTQALAQELLSQGIAVCAVHPGWVQTDMGGKEADITAQASAKGICELALQLSIEQSGQFLTWEGEIHPW